MKEIKFKKFHQWTPEQDRVLKAHFHDIVFSRWHGSRWPYLKGKLEKRGLAHVGLTEKAISRRCYRLGLRSYNQKNYIIKGNCHLCGEEIFHKHRYKNPLCNDCRHEQKYSYTSSDRGKAYHKQYIKDWRKKENENISKTN